MVRGVIFLGIVKGLTENVFVRFCGVPKIGVSRSKHLLKPQPLPHQYWGLELRTSLTKARDGAKFADTSCITLNKATSAS